jgi:hypothetical protein
LRFALLRGVFRHCRIEDANAASRRSRELRSPTEQPRHSCVGGWEKCNETVCLFDCDIDLITAAARETTQAAPMTPLPSEMARDAGAATITPVHYYRHRYRHGGYPLAGYWNYYRTDWPGRGNSVESTR